MLMQDRGFSQLRIGSFNCCHCYISDKNLQLALAWVLAIVESPISLDQDLSLVRDMRDQNLGLVHAMARPESRTYPTLLKRYRPWRSRPPSVAELLGIGWMALQHWDLSDGAVVTSVQI